MKKVENERGELLIAVKKNKKNTKKNRYCVFTVQKTLLLLFQEKHTNRAALSTGLTVFTLYS